MASPLDIINAEKNRKKELYLPPKIDLAVNLIQAFIKNNNPLGLKISIILAGARENIVYDKDNGVTFNVDELCKLCRIDRKYLSLNKKKMTETYYQYVDENGNLTGTRPIHTFTYMNKNRDIRIEVSSKAKQLFNNLKTKENINGFRFTQAISNNLMIYDLKDVNKHTLKMQLLLEMINNFTTEKRKYFSLEELNMYFETKYKRFADINRFVLKKVQEDTKKYSTISFKIKEKEEAHGKIAGVYIEIEDNINLFTGDYSEPTDTSAYKETTTDEDMRIKKIREWQPNLRDLDLTVEFGIVFFNDVDLEDEFELYVNEQIAVFKKLCIENKIKYNKDNLDISFKRHIEGAFNHRIDFFSKKIFNTKYN